MSKVKIFDTLKNFSETEAWGNPAKINGMLLLMLDAIATEAKAYGAKTSRKVSVVIHCAYDLSGHAGESYHYTGDAVDFHVKGLTHQEAYTVIKSVCDRLQMSEHMGLGVYPDWAHPGFHMDIRQIKKGQTGRWACLKGKYVGLAEGLKVMLKSTTIVS